MVTDGVGTGAASSLTDTSAEPLVGHAFLDVAEMRQLERLEAQIALLQDQLAAVRNEKLRLMTRSRVRALRFERRYR